MLRVGLTGGIGSGKSAACEVFESLGVRVIDTDQIARDVVAPETPGFEAIVHAFGTEILTPEGWLNRRYLREQVFTDELARHRLEALLHPLILSEMRSRIQVAPGSYCIVAIPLLVEKRWDSEVDRILVVDTPPELQISRVQARDGLSRMQVERIVAAQATREERLKAADDVIVNDGDINNLREQVTIFHHRYLALAR